MGSAEIIAIVADDPRQDIVRDILRDVSDIASPPQVYLTITRLLDDQTATAKDFAAAVERDAGLTVRLLKLVNSPFYGSGGAVDSVPKAITRIGLNELENLVLSACAVDSFFGIAADSVDMHRLWSHSVYCAIAARELGKRLNCIQPARLYVAGLLHDVGSLAIYARYPELAERSIVESAGNETRLASFEREWIGIDHAVMGARLLETWHIPNATCEAIRWHHDATHAPTNVLEASLVEVADLLSNQSEHGRFSGFEATSDEDDDLLGCLARRGIDVDIDITTLIDTVEEEFVESIEAMLR